MAITRASDPANVPAILGRGIVERAIPLPAKGVIPSSRCEPACPRLRPQNLVFEAKVIASLDRLPLTTGLDADRASPSTILRSTKPRSSLS
jgi:hypothetical protein